LLQPGAVFRRQKQRFFGSEHEPVYHTQGHVSLIYVTIH
jgi:hypothetical protein